MNAEILSEQNITGFLDDLTSQNMSEDKRRKAVSEAREILEGFRDYVIREGYDAETREALENYMIEKVPYEDLSQEETNRRMVINSYVESFWIYLTKKEEKSNNKPESAKSTKSSTKKQRTRHSKKGEKNIMTDENIQGLAENEVTESEQLDSKATTTEECTENSTTDENITTPKVTRVKGVKRIQVSAYLPYETYEIMKILSSATNESIGDTLASFAIEYATKNRETAESLKKVLQGMKVKRPKIE